jgi:ABC transporter substrate binding protein
MSRRSGLRGTLFRKYAAYFAGLVSVALLNPAVIVAEGNQAMFALKHATTTIPIVMAVAGDPVGSGFVTSLARPGANITGLSNTAEQLSGKRLELLKELVPRLTRVAILRNPANPTHANLLRETEAEALRLGMALTPSTSPAKVTWKVPSPPWLGTAHRPWSCCRRRSAWPFDGRWWSSPRATVSR